MGSAPNLLAIPWYGPWLLGMVMAFLGFIALMASLSLRMGFRSLARARELSADTAVRTALREPRFLVLTNGKHQPDPLTGRALAYHGLTVNGSGSVGHGVGMLLALPVSLAFALVVPFPNAFYLLTLLVPAMALLRMGALVGNTLGTLLGLHRLSAGAPPTPSLRADYRVARGVVFGIAVLYVLVASVSALAMTSSRESPALWSIQPGDVWMLWLSPALALLVAAFADAAATSLARVPLYPELREPGAHAWLTEPKRRRLASDQYKAALETQQLLALGMIPMLSIVMLTLQPPYALLGLPVILACLAFCLLARVVVAARW